MTVYAESSKIDLFYVYPTRRHRRETAAGNKSIASATTRHRRRWSSINSDDDDAADDDDAVVSSMVGGLRVAERQRLWWHYPRIGALCAAALLGRLVHVPCNVDAVLEADYGADWRRDHPTSAFAWDRSHHNLEYGERFNGRDGEAQWAQLYRRFD